MIKQVQNQVDIKFSEREKWPELHEDLDHPTLERLAITHPSHKLDVPSTTQLLEDIEQGSNIVELIISDMLQGKTDIKKNQVICDGQVKA